MKFCRFRSLNASSPHDQLPSYGLIEGGRVLQISGAPWFSWTRGPQAWEADQVQFLAPVDPTKIVCVGRNYAAHAAELGNELPKEPLIFLKPPSSLVGPGDPIILTPQSQRVEHEGELALIVGKKCSHLKDDDDALPYLLGYSCLNDITARDLQKSDVQFTRAKGFDTFCPVGPHIETELNPADLTVETRVNGTLRQSGRTSLMIYPVAFIVRWISRVMTLSPGDVIATGTPAGVGPLVAGDSVEVSVSGIGVLRNPVHAASA
ncbi:MAG TPA: fumarylacetoacetate hydrolase family protein [Candidatus Acidoferrum sp.]|nr:fumarylacetoacetate hydrolase family protein [Candidatus Acidoferrum sp.]